jgi:tRNA pseudouridine(55) synthase
MNPLPRRLTIQKHVGETPLTALNRARDLHGIAASIPLTYAGRLDPMASGTLLILVGDECKKQEQYRALDKEYVVELLFGISSDTGDVLGVVKKAEHTPTITESSCRTALKDLRGPITLTYPHFSSKTVQGKPLHTWTLEGRLDEITVPTKNSRIHTLEFNGLRTLSHQEMMETVMAKIGTIPPVTDPRKALGEDFRRDAVRASWHAVPQDADGYQLLRFSCTASSGTYMRSLCEHIAEKLGTTGLAYSIHRTRIGNYLPVCGNFGMWTRVFR